MGDVVAVRDDFGADEAFGEVSVDDRGGIYCAGPGAHWPGAGFFVACGEEGVQAQQLISRSDDSVKARLAHAGFLKKLLLVGCGQFGDFRFQFVADCNHSGLFLGCLLFYGFQMRVVGEAVLRNIGDVHYRLGGEQMQFANMHFVILIERQTSKRGCGVQVSLDFFQ